MMAMETELPNLRELNEGTRTEETSLGTLKDIKRRFLKRANSPYGPGWGTRRDGSLTGDSGRQMKGGYGKGGSLCGNFARGPGVRDFYWGNLKDLETVVSPYRGPGGEAGKRLIFR